MKNLIMQTISFLKGKKTYIIAGSMILLGILTDDSQMILNGFAFAGLRLAIK